MEQRGETLQEPPFDVTVPLALELVEELIATRNQADAELEAFHNLKQSYEDDLKACYQEVSYLHSQIRLTDKQLDEAGLPFMAMLLVAVIGGGIFWGIVIAIVMW